jgi:type IV secretion system protein VirD4
MSNGRTLRRPSPRIPRRRPVERRIGRQSRRSVGRFSVRSTAFAVARMAHRYPWRPATVAAGVLILAALFRRAGWDAPFHYLAAPMTVVLVGCTLWWALRHVARPHSTKALIRRRAELDQRAGGVATRLDIAEHASAKALKLRAHILRPSLAGLSRWERWRLDARLLGVEIARLGWGWWGERIYSSCEDATLRIGGPRTGKTLSLACHGLDAPGALITTSTRLDLAEMVHDTRTDTTGRTGRVGGGTGVVHVFNPAGLGGLASTVRWRALAGCEDFATAMRRATDLVPESSGEAERWDVQARRILTLLLHAAAVSGRSMRDVVRWISDTTHTSRDEIVEALMAPQPDPHGDGHGDGQGDTARLIVPEGGRDRAAAIRAFYATNDRTRTSITTTIAVPLAWMSDDRARRLGDADPDDPQLIDITGLIARGETLHLIGHEDHTGLSPLIAALVAEIAHAARTLASARRGGRLDPPLTMLLDEAALVCPVPLDRWTADMGGRGVTIHISVQSLSQLRQRWGDDGAGTILANVATFIVFGGSPSAEDLRDISSLTGEHRMKVVGADHDSVDDLDDGERRGEYRWVPVMSAAQIRALDTFQVLVMRRGLHTAVGWTPTVTQRKGWRQISLIETTPDLQVPTAAELDDMVGFDELVELHTTARPSTRPSQPVPAWLWRWVGAPILLTRLRSRTVRAGRHGGDGDPSSVREDA